MSVVAPPPSRIHPERARAHRDGPSSPSRGTLVVLLLLMAGTHVACDSGLEPPEVARTGVIVAEINYEGQWPAPDSLNDLRFVAMRFVPRDTSDLLELNRIAFSERLEYYVGSDTVTISDVRPGVFVYTGVAQNYARNIFAWRPLALYEEDAGIFEVASGETTLVRIDVDFGDPPIFPPPVR